MTTQECLSAIHLALVESPIVADYTIVRQRVASESGYLRVRTHLVNGDFVEAAEFSELTTDGIRVSDYRHQWMDGQCIVLRKRWDSAPHHLTLDNAPYHCHDGDEGSVIASRPMSIQDVLEVIAREMLTGDV